MKMRGYELNSSFIFDKALLTLIDNLPTPQDYNLTEWKNKNLREIKGLNFNPSKIEPIIMMYDATSLPTGLIVIKYEATDPPIHPKTIGINKGNDLRNLT